MVQREPGPQLQFLRPGLHRGSWFGAAIGHHGNFGRIDAEHQFDTFGVQRQITHTVFGHKVFQIGQSLGHHVNLCLRNGLRLGQECVGQRVTDGLDVHVLIGLGQPQQGHARTQALQQFGQILNHLGPVIAVGFGTGGPDQISG